MALVTDIFIAFYFENKVKNKLLYLSVNTIASGKCVVLFTSTREQQRDTIRQA